VCDQRKARRALCLAPPTCLRRIDRRRCGLLQVVEPGDRQASQPGLLSRRIDSARASRVVLRLLVACCRLAPPPGLSRRPVAAAAAAEWCARRAALQQLLLEALDGDAQGVAASGRTGLLQRERGGPQPGDGMQRAARHAVAEQPRPGACGARAAGAVQQQLQAGRGLLGTQPRRGVARVAGAAQQRLEAR
jgi:hypothetical protein